ncbi:glycine cleavage system aminomethyltransferase GcvT [Salibacterium sp. K-3]
MKELKRTPLFSASQNEGAKMVDFGGWEMPVYFTGIKKEHEAVRAAAGLFDVSHMGEAIITGNGASAWLQTVITNDISRLFPGKVMYTLLCNEKGGVVDDLLIYQIAEEQYLLVLNAANTQKDIEWLRSLADDNVEIKDVSDAYAMLALQGPEAETILQRLSSFELSTLGSFRFRQDIRIGNINCLVSRTGYTGEDGFEIYCPPSGSTALWNMLLSEGKQEGLLPCGLGARDTLRMEAGLPLYGHEISETISPLEAGLGFAVKLNKASSFIGKEALEQEKADGPVRRIIGLKMTEKGIPRAGYPVLNGDRETTGFITTGTHSPTLGIHAGMALIKKEEKNAGYYVEIRGKTLQAEQIKLPFYQRRKNH